MRQIHLRKKPQCFFNDQQDLFLLDKFGNIYKFPAAELVAQFLEESLRELEPVKPEPVMSLFQNTVCLFQDDVHHELIISDDYYKIKVLNQKNIQEIKEIFSLRKFYLNFVVKSEDFFILVFDDGKFLSTNLPISRMEEVFSEEKLVEQRDLLHLNFESAKEMFKIRDREEFCLVFVEQREEKFYFEIRVLTFDTEQKRFHLVETQTPPLQDNDYYLINEGEKVVLNDATIKLTTN